MFGNDSPQTGASNLASSRGSEDAMRSLEKLENLALLAQTKSLESDEDSRAGGSESSVDRELETFALLAGSKAMEGINEDSLSSASGAPISFDNMTPSAAETGFSHKLQQIREEEMTPGETTGPGVDKDSILPSQTTNATNFQTKSKSKYHERIKVLFLNLFFRPM